MVYLGWYYFFSYGWYIPVGITVKAIFCLAYFSKLVGTFNLKILRYSFLKKSAGSHSKRGPKPPYLRENGDPAKILYQNLATKFSNGISW